MELLSVVDVAARLRLDPRTVRAYIRSGRLPAVRIGKQYRIRAVDLAAFVRNGRHAAGTVAPEPEPEPEPEPSEKLREGRPAESGQVSTDAAVVLRIDAGSTPARDRLVRMMNTIGFSEGAAMQVIAEPRSTRLRVLGSGSLAAAAGMLANTAAALKAVEG
ncbi:MAG: helix-turn-helix domain-containing protein [Pseudoclavibacter sp.]